MRLVPLAAIVVPAGRPMTLVGPGTILAGCHFAGHYVAGMRATIEITGAG